MWGEGRSLAEGVYPQIISLAVTRKGIDDEPLKAILKSISQGFA